MTTYGAAISQHPDAAQAIGEVLGAVLEAVGPTPDVAVLFITDEHLPSLAQIGDTVRSLLTPGVLIGCSARAVTGGRVEVGQGPAISLWAGRTGTAEAIRLEATRSGDGVVVAGMSDAATIGRRTLVLLAESFDFPAEALVREVNSRYPGLTIVGGVASAGDERGSRLLLDGELHSEGAVGVLLPEGLGEVAVVSQGCRPVGAPFAVTQADGNTIGQLAFRPAAERLRETISNANDHDRSLLERGLHIGIALNENAEQFGAGSFLIRGVLGADHATGTVTVGERVAVGTTVQFHVRDAVAADEDLKDMVRQVDADAALVFTCDGRIGQLFDAPDHDATLVSEAVDDGPVAGMFCAAEIGPAGGRNHIHGFTASVLFFYG